jgi:site-specific DNA-methyltransferase (adenine-specific)/modification methylase
MKPYWSNEELGLYIYNEDCIDAMDDLSDNIADITLTSPPYNMNLRIRNGKYCSRQIVKELTTKYSSFSDNLSMDDYFRFSYEVVNRCLRIAPILFYNIQFLTGNKRALYRLIGEFSDDIKEFIVWDKVNSQPAIGEGVLNSQWEAILVFDKENAISRKFDGEFDRGELSNLWSIKRGKKPTKCHGAVYPVELVEMVVGNFSSKSGVVFDPFLGTGSTMVGCSMLGRGCIGIEIDEKYCEVAVNRVEKEIKKQRNTGVRLWN